MTTKFQKTFNRSFTFFSFFLEVGVHFCNDFEISGAFEMNFFVLYLIKGRCLVLLRMWETQ